MADFTGYEFGLDLVFVIKDSKDGEIVCAPGEVVTPPTPPTPAPGPQPSLLQANAFQGGIGYRLRS